MNIDAHSSGHQFDVPKDLHDLVDEVIEQIKRDIELGDYTAIVELLMYVPRKNLEGYLPEEE